MMIMHVIAKWRDSEIQRNSMIYDKFTERVLSQLPNGIILGDSGYPLLEWLLVPYVDNPGTTAAQHRYNRTLRSARSTVERTIGILKRRWACLKELRFRPEKCCQVVVVCCMLHNFCRHIPIDEEDLGVWVVADHYEEDLDESEEGRKNRNEFVQSFFR